MSICLSRATNSIYIPQIFFKNTLNILKYVEICLNISLSDEHEAYSTNKMNGQSGQMSRHMNNHGTIH
jgi:hypothetical protein